MEKKFQNYLMRILEKHCPNKRFEILLEMRPLLEWIKKEEEKQKMLSRKLLSLLKDSEAGTLLKNLNYQRSRFFSNLKKALS